MSRSFIFVVISDVVMDVIALFILVCNCRYVYSQNLPVKQRKKLSSTSKMGDNCELKRILNAI